MRNLVSIGFFTQTDEGEFILRVDEYRITGGSVEVVDYRTLQTLLLQKSFTEFSEPSEAIKSLALIQRRDELLHRVKNFRFRDWKDFKHDSDVYNGRLLHNRVGYTTLDQIPMLLGLRSEPWLGSLEEEILEKWWKPRYMNYAKALGVEFKISDLDENGRITVKIVD